jgi:hypothetical protein
MGNQPGPNDRASRASSFPSAVLKITFAELLRSCSRNISSPCCGVAATRAMDGTFCMPTMKSLSEVYLANAAELAAKAKSASKPAFKKRFERMALAYQRLAEKHRTKAWKKKKGHRRRG